MIKCDSQGILWLAEERDGDRSMLKHNLVCLEMGFRQPSIMHGCVAEIIRKDYLTPEGGVLPPFTQMTEQAQWLQSVNLTYESPLKKMI